jgi:integrase
MASIRKRGDKWQVQVRRHGSAPLNRTFIAREDAIRWAREQERAIDRGELFAPPVSDRALTFLHEILDRYVREVSPRKRGAMDRFQLTAVIDQMGKLPLLGLTPSHLASYRDHRLKEVAPATVAKEMALVCHALKVAVDEWGMAVPVEKFRAVRKPTPPSGRTRRLATGEQEQLALALRSCRNPFVRPVFLFALATGMRRGEVLSLTWANVDWDNRVAFLPMTKNGEPRRVPLSPAAMQSLRHVQDARLQPSESLPEPSCELVFPISPNAFRLAWERVKRRAGIEDLRFHDLRHEAISRFFEIGLSVPEVALISGHKDARMLFRYTHLKAENVANKLERLGS